ncbi:MAG: hypothetical protein KDD45_05245 [Bdellovibrionales bacterium]|nr:hypothetical protein [Bdellovibrionales bacterium]
MTVQPAYLFAQLVFVNVKVAQLMLIALTMDLNAEMVIAHQEIMETVLVLPVHLEVVPVVVVLDLVIKLFNQ